MKNERSCGRCRRSFLIARDDEVICCPGCNSYTLQDEAACEQVFARTRVALEMLVLNQLDHHYQNISAGWQPREYLVTRLSGPRRSGQTRAAIDVAMQYFKKPGFVFVNHEMASQMSGVVSEMASRHGKVELPEEHVQFLAEAWLLPRDCDAVVVDPVSMFPPNKLEEFVDMLLAVHPKHIILVG